MDTERDLNKDLHKYAVEQSQLHGKRILRADDTRDTTYAFVGGGIGGVLALCAYHLFHIHGEIVGLLFVIAGFFTGLIVGAALFDKLFVKDESWQPPLFDQSWDEYRIERRRQMQGGRRH